MTTYIIRFGGLAPTFHAGNSISFHPSDAIRYNSVEMAKSDCLSIYGDRQAKICDSETLQFVKWVNY